MRKLGFKLFEPFFIGESCLCWSIGEKISSDASNFIITIYRSLKKLQIQGELKVWDIVPSYNSIAVYFDPVFCEIKKVQEQVNFVFSSHINRSDRTNSTIVPGKTVELLVHYDGEDIMRVAERSDLSPNEVADLHAAGDYLVAMIGFQPHFPYLIGLPEKLITPRLESPRARVPAGSVAIGGFQTGVYPSESPGGWNLIGRTDPKLLIPLKPGDKVVFKKS